jgi:hypothetical protein
MKAVGYCARSVTSAEDGAGWLAFPRPECPRPFYPWLPPTPTPAWSPPRRHAGPAPPFEATGISGDVPFTVEFAAPGSAVQDHSGARRLHLLVRHPSPPRLPSRDW